jgi:hypothetical protein
LIIYHKAKEEEEEEKAETLGWPMNRAFVCLYSRSPHFHFSGVFGLLPATHHYRHLPLHSTGLPFQVRYFENNNNNKNN